jgi:hypothetical protein
MCAMSGLLLDTLTGSISGRVLRPAGQAKNTQMSSPVPHKTVTRSAASADQKANRKPWPLAL